MLWTFFFFLNQICRFCHLSPQTVHRRPSQRILGGLHFIPLPSDFILNTLDLVFFYNHFCRFCHLSPETVHRRPSQRILGGLHFIPLPSDFILNALGLVFF